MKKAQKSIKTEISYFIIYSLYFILHTFYTAPANALPPNQSDNTGTNIWNNTAPVFGGGSKIDPEILNTAKRLSKDLDDAYAACQASATAAGSVPRRFARRPDNHMVPCNSAECQRLNRLIDETKTFLNSLNSLQAEQLRASRVLRIW